jgi:DNA-binding transcriptional regulator YiaG
MTISVIINISKEGMSVNCLEQKATVKIVVQEAVTSVSGQESGLVQEAVASGLVQESAISKSKEKTTISSRRQLVLMRRRIGQNIHNIRKRKKFTLEKLSKISVVGTNLLDQYEIGKNHINLEKIAIIAKSLDATLEDVMSP